LKLDATVADQLIVYPTDINLLDRSRRESERLIDILYSKSDWKVKPRTYRRVARRQFLELIKSRKKRKNYTALRRACGKQLRYLRRNLQRIDKLLDHLEGQPIPLRFRDLKIYWVIQHIYRQQQEMYQSKQRRCDDRIVNIYQPYVRPIKRGKDKVDTEFGAKLGVSEFNGLSRINHLSWDAYHEAADLIAQVEAYRTLLGYYPAVVLVDRIYLTRENRRFLKEKGIRHTGIVLGRPAQEMPDERRRRRQERAMRNHIEGKFGQGKNAYGLREIRARRQDTSESWIGAIFFVMNLVKLVKVMGLVAALILWFANILFYIPFWRQKVHASRAQAKKLTGLGKADRQNLHLRREYAPQKAPRQAA
jgi:IS5 family transposase